MASAGEALAVSSLMRIMHVIGFRNSMESQHGRVSSKELCKAYLEKVTPAKTKDADDVNFSLFDNSKTIYDRALKDTRIFDIVRNTEETLGKGYYSIAKMLIIIQKSWSDDDIYWCFKHLHHLWTSDQCNANEFSTRALEGRSQGQGGKGIADCRALLREASHADIFRGEFCQGGGHPPRHPG